MNRNLMGMKDEMRQYVEKLFPGNQSYLFPNMEGINRISN